MAVTARNVKAMCPAVTRKRRCADLMLPPSGVVQELDGVAWDANAGDVVACSGFDFQPSIACSDFDLSRGAVEPVAQNLRREDVLAGRGRRELEALRTHEQANQAPGRAP